MSTFEQWEEVNNRFLGEALAGIRARLERLAATSDGTDTPVAAAPAATKSTWMQRLIGQGTAPQSPIAQQPAPRAQETATEPVQQDVDAEMPALHLLARLLGLNAFEADVLLLAVAMELDSRLPQLCAKAHGKPYPTFGLAMAMFDHAAWDAMSPERPLRYWRLVDVATSASQPMTASALKADERIVNYLKGANHLDERLAPLLSPIAADARVLPPSQQSAAEEVVRRLGAAVGHGPLPVVQLLGNDAESKLLVAQRTASELGFSLYRIAADVVPSAIADQESFIRLWRRETALLPVALYVDGDTDRASAQGTALQRLIGRLSGVVVLDVREPWPGLGREMLSIDVAKPTPLEQKALWSDAVGAELAPHAERVAMHFDFGATAIRRLAAGALAASADDIARLPDVLWSHCLARARPTLDQLAQLVDAKARWDDLELPASEKSLLRQIVDQVEHRATVYDDWGFRTRMNRGLGISVLFAGESGTGKTMAAEVIANELGLLLYRIDLSAVVNKYIGETEKNLRRLFDAAEAGGAILLFDEADALFGKRSEVKDSHDRYSNIEVNYLLQRMEAFRGLAILATNMKSALDSAFVRRLRFIVKFPFPGVDERESIWRKALAGVDVVALDFGRLARFALSGGSIHGVALNAAFLAARAGRPLSMQMALDAVRAEFRKLEKPVNEAEFRWLDSVAGSA